MASYAPSHTGMTNNLFNRIMTIYSLERYALVFALQPPVLAILTLATALWVIGWIELFRRATS